MRRPLSWRIANGFHGTKQTCRHVDFVAVGVWAHDETMRTTIVTDVSTHVVIYVYLPWT